MKVDVDNAPEQQCPDETEVENAQECQQALVCIDCRKLTLATEANDPKQRIDRR